MFEYYIKKIHIGQVRHLKDVDIPICEDKCRHLILTGRNGSGKTSLLEAMRYYLNVLCQESTIKFFRAPFVNIDVKTEQYPGFLNASGLLCIVKGKENGMALSLKFNVSFEQMYVQYNQKSCVPYVMSFFSDDRNFSSPQPKMIEKVELKDYYNILDKPRELFVKYLLDMKMTEALAMKNGHEEKALQISEWFSRLEKLLQQLFDDKKLKLLFNEETFEFQIKEPGGKLFDFNTMSAGYAAAFDIIVDLMMRMEKNSNRSFHYDMPGIVLIDEIETHLHLELQKLILPMLTELFPNIQFIVSTHSPFVINSIENATIFDLEKKTLVSNGLGNIPYEGIIDGYFNVDRLSAELRSKFDEYKTLCKKKKLTDLDFAKAVALEAYLDEVPDYLAVDFAEEYSRRKLEFHNKKGGR